MGAPACALPEWIHSTPVNQRELWAPQQELWAPQRELGAPPTRARSGRVCFSRAPYWSEQPALSLQASSGLGTEHGLFSSGRSRPETPLAGQIRRSVSSAMFVLVQHIHYLEPFCLLADKITHYLSSLMGSKYRTRLQWLQYDRTVEHFSFKLEIILQVTFCLLTPLSFNKASIKHY